MPCLRRLPRWKLRLSLSAWVTLLAIMGVVASGTMCGLAWLRHYCAETHLESRGFNIVTSIRDASSISEQALSGILGNRVTIVEAEDLAVDENDIIMLKRFRNVKCLSFSGVSFSQAALDEFSPPQCTMHMSFYSSNVDDAVVRRFADLDRLTLLELVDTKVSDLSMSTLAHIDTLEYIALNGAAITDSGVSQLLRLPALECLDLSRTDVSGEAFRDSAQCNSLLVLFLDRTNIDDEGLELLLHLPLAELHLNNTRITDAGLLHLEHMSTLKTVSLLNTKTSPGARKRLRAILLNNSAAGRHRPSDEPTATAR